MIQFYVNNVTNLHQLTSHSIRHHALQHGDRIVTIYYCDVTSIYKVDENRLNACIQYEKALIPCQLVQIGRGVLKMSAVRRSDRVLGPSYKCYD